MITVLIVCNTDRFDCFSFFVFFVGIVAAATAATAVANVVDSESSFPFLILQSSCAASLVIDQPTVQFYWYLDVVNKTAT